MNSQQGMFSGITNYYNSFSFTESTEANYMMWPLIVFIVMVIVLIIVIYSNKPPTIKDYLPTIVSLSEATYPLTSSQAHAALISGSGSTLAGMFNVTIGDRTNQMASSATHNYTTLFGVYGSMEFQLAPANISTTDSTARLLISTKGTNGFGVESIPLPPLPAQKWVFIGILRDGRRYDVLYNDKIVASHRLDAYPNTGVQNQLQVGADPPNEKSSSRFLGNAIHLIALNYRMSPRDLAVLRAQYIDTTGAPPTPLPFPFPVDLFSLQTVCIPGIPCNPVEKPPANRLQAWSTPYA